MKLKMLWGDGEYEFHLRLGEVRELQTKTGVGPFRLFERIRKHDWFIDDLRETLRLGLIGAGMENVAALTLVMCNFDNRSNKLQHVEPVMGILAAFLTGDDPDDPVGKASAEEGKKEPTESSPSPQSTATE